MKDEKAPEEVRGREENTVKTSSLLSFLEGLGIPINKARIMMASDVSKEVLPRVNPNGISLTKLMEKMDAEFDVERGTPCPTSHLNSVGLLAVYNNSLKLEEVEREVDFVQKGGQWKPDCVPRKKVAIVVPFRDRQEHLNIFIRHMHKYLRWQMLEYRIFIIEQADNERFNRGMLMNVGFSEAMKVGNFTCVIFHDVDLIPEDARNDYSCPSSPRHMSTAVSRMDYILKYETLFGGVEGFWVEHYRHINGFPNRFWGWGGEDDDLYVRITERRLSFTRPAHMIGRYTMLDHTHTEEQENPLRHEELRRSEAHIDADGLNTLTYNVMEFQEKPLYTLISVSLQ
ncbi:beta-1,4-galactosyltransferase 6-like isoform X2 [Stylophora pistillata]|uniref:beta-1,4-galactosyltransferase 6-like isoform X2 n=1 Tax=Stylophora pistillata TaxID=50429 RepID=UPI000C0487AF|nr:beta-1,4-galactosyltransferase 6-like isoform X2 [Stylophora pistillata]